MRQELPGPTSYLVMARNTATASANRIHDDGVARQYGFRGGLVPGAVVYEHLCHPLVGAWGRQWLSAGSISVRFISPIYDGEEVRVEARALSRSSTGPEAELLALNPEGTVCARAKAGFAAATATLPLRSSYPEAPLPEPLPPAVEPAFRARDVLGSVDATLSPAEASAYLDSIGESLPAYRSEALVPPGHLVSTANRLLTSNFSLGPWIHASSDVMHFATAAQGEPLQMRGRVSDLFEKGGHKFVELEALVVASDRRPIAHLRHTAIYEPARRG